MEQVDVQHDGLNSYFKGKQGNYVYYRGEHTFESLQEFVMSFVQNRIHVPVIRQMRNSDKPIAYVLGTNSIESYALTRIAFHLVSYEIYN